MGSCYLGSFISRQSTKQTATLKKIGRLITRSSRFCWRRSGRSRGAWAPPTRRRPTPRSEPCRRRMQSGERRGHISVISSDIDVYAFHPLINEFRPKVQGEPSHRIVGLTLIWLFHCLPDSAWADGSLAEWAYQLGKLGGTSKSN